MKIYYKVEVRIFEIFSEDSEGQLAELKSWSDGFIRFEDGCFEGYATDDKLTGDFRDNELWIEMLTDNNEYLSFICEIESLELPGRYTLKSNIEDGLICEFFFKEKLKKITEYEKIESEIKRVNDFHIIP